MCVNLACGLKSCQELQQTGGSCHRQKSKNPEDKNSAIEVYFQCDVDEHRERALASMVEQLTAEPFFNMLRTKV